MAFRSHAYDRTRVQRVEIPTSQPFLERERQRQTYRQDPDKQIRTAELDDELYSLDGRICKREIIPVTLHISYIVPLLKD